MRWWGWWCFVSLAVASLRGTDAVDRNKFRTCSTSGFCARNRDKTSQMHVVNGVISQSTDGLTLSGQVADGDGLPLTFTMQALSIGAFRFRATEPEQDGIAPRYEPPDVLLQEGLTASKWANIADSSSEFTATCAEASLSIRVIKSPFRIDILDASSQRTIVSVNKDNKMYFEQRRAITKSPQESETKSSDSKTGAEESKEDGRKIIDWGEDGKPIYEDGATEEQVESAQVDASKLTSPETEAPESFGGHTDHKPNGHMSVGLDVTFAGTKHVYGLPEHAAPFSLKTTRGGENAFNEPYRMYNLDVFEYEIDEPMALYGHIPVVIGHSSGGTAGIFWNNPSETFVDVSADTQSDKQITWVSESGVMELFIMVGPAPKDVSKQYASLTGTTPLPPLFSIGYHQCRWNYRDEKDVHDVNAEFEKHDLPYDVIWLDIEHTDGKRYFTWDHTKFPHPEEMQANLARYGRKLVTIVDPHIKRDAGYYVHKEATEKGLYIKDKDGTTDFKGWCWPGDSSYLDFTSAHVRDWWAEQFAFDKYKGSSEIMFTWNDMNEPSVFNGPEVSMTKEALNLDRVEHREWHNLYGFYQHMATAAGLVHRFQKLAGAGTPSTDPAIKRPFVLSRSFFAGSQRHGAIWTGDNAAEWSHLKIASHMLLSMNIAGLPFVGADVGGFFKNPNEELLQRWYQAGSFQPFFRAHAHIDTKRREPWLFGEQVLGRIAKAVKTRYSLLPLWYTVFHEHETSGAPVMRPLWYLAPKDEKTFDIGDQWLVGSDLLVKPVTDEGATTVDVYFPTGTAWYEFEYPHGLREGGSSRTEQAPIDKIPVFQRAGSIIPRKMRVRRNSFTMRNDPYTLYIALDPSTQSAKGTLHIDDEASFAYKSGAACAVTFSMEKNRISAESHCGENFDTDKKLNVERIVVLGHDGKVTEAVLESTGLTVPCAYDASSMSLMLRKPVHSFIRFPFSITLK